MPIFWNLEQSLRAQLGLAPKDCWCSAGLRAKGFGCEPGQTFRCDVCDREMPYCRGAVDNMPDTCDYCWEAPADDYYKNLFSTKQ